MSVLVATLTSTVHVAFAASLPAELVGHVVASTGWGPMSCAILGGLPAEAEAGQKPRARDPPPPKGSRAC